MPRDTRIEHDRRHFGFLCDLLHLCTVHTQAKTPTSMRNASPHGITDNVAQMSSTTKSTLPRPAIAPPPNGERRLLFSLRLRHGSFPGPRHSCQSCDDKTPQSCDARLVVFRRVPRASSSSHTAQRLRAKEARLARLAVSTAMPRSSSKSAPALPTWCKNCLAPREQPSPG
jgi:hypothetical protein